MPEVPVTVTLKVPVLAELLTVRVSVVLLVDGFGLKDADTPPGRFDAENITLPLNPFDGVMVMVLAPLCPCTTVTLLGEAERV